uniref:Uncharacterized protein n=1 Tax=Astyanax mexicanus TaxID=7994 RepID=A0A8B9HV39_ASTMX
MSVNYAAGLSPYADKGICGLPEGFFLFFYFYFYFFIYLNMKMLIKSTDGCCGICGFFRRQYVRDTVIGVMGLKPTGRYCEVTRSRGLRACRLRTIYYCRLESSGQIMLFIYCVFTLLQDKHAHLRINGYVDEVMGQLMKLLGLEIPEWAGPTMCESSGGDADILPFGAWKKEVKIELKIEEKEDGLGLRKKSKRTKVKAEEVDEKERVKKGEEEEKDTRKALEKEPISDSRSKPASTHSVNGSTSSQDCTDTEKPCEAKKPRTDPPSS